MKRFLKKRTPIRILALLFLCLSLSSCNAPSKLFSSSVLRQEQSSFDSYTDQLFMEEMQENTINLHYTLSKPEDFGIKSHKISLGSLSKDSSKNSKAAIENILARLAGFDYDALNGKQQLTYDILKDSCERELSASPFYYYEEPLRPTTGIQSELPILLAEYAFYDSCDVTYYLALLTCLEDYFQEIALFEQEKSKEGLFMSPYAAETLIEACKTFTKNPSDNYLIHTFDTRIDALDNISEEKKALYKRQNQSLVENAVIPAYENLTDLLAKLKNTGNNNAGLCGLPKGKEYYKYLVRTNTGSEKSIEELQKQTKQQRRLDMERLQQILATNPELLHADENELDFGEPEEILNHLQKAMLSEFYPAANTSFEVNYVHQSLEDTLAPAFYLTAPIDDISRNVIYLNKSSQYRGIQLFTTLAHEGYPGHLYQTTGSYQAGLAPVRALFHYPGYVEGWATYVEMLSYRYAGLEEAFADMLMHNQSALLSLYAEIDMGIHYDGWQLADTAAFLSAYGITDNEVIQSIFELIVEEPSHYLKYYIGYLEFLELKDYAKETWKENYSDRAFHQAVLRIGPAPFSILKKYLNVFYTVSDS